MFRVASNLWIDRQRRERRETSSEEQPEAAAPLVLGTTTGAIKAALHRGRGKLAERAPVERGLVSSAILDAFCDAFNARDIDRLIDLMLDTTTAEIVGIATEYGPQKMRRSDTGSLYHTLFSPIAHAVAPELLAGIGRSTSNTPHPPAQPSPSEVCRPAVRRYTPQTSLTRTRRGVDCGDLQDHDVEC